MEKTFNIIGKQNNEVVAYATWEDNKENRERLAEMAEYGYEETSDTYVQGYDSKFYVEGTEPAIPDSIKAEERIAELESYLASTDWYAIRESETGIDIPADIKQARADARLEISSLRGDI